MQVNAAMLDWVHKRKPPECACCPRKIQTTLLHASGKLAHVLRLYAALMAIFSCLLLSTTTTSGL